MTWVFLSAPLAEMAMLTYAQNFEDVVLERMFHDVRNGTYIDIGAFHPTIDSVTRHFYDRGWDGINVEPISRFYSLFTRDRPRDININCAVGANCGEVAFHEWGDSGAATLFENPEYQNSLGKLGLIHEVTAVPMVTMAEILGELRRPQVEFLKIDVEGAEKDVLLGCDLALFRPRVILVEAIAPKLPGCDALRFKAAWPEWEYLLLGQGYRFGLFDGLNRFYYREEDPHFADLLMYPANTTEGFELAPEHSLRRPLPGAVTDPQSMRPGFFQRLGRSLDKRLKKAG